MVLKTMIKFYLTNTSRYKCFINFSILCLSSIVAGTNGNLTVSEHKPKVAKTLLIPAGLFSEKIRPIISINL